VTHCLGCGAKRPRDAPLIAPAETGGGGASIVIQPARGRGLLIASGVYAGVVLLMLALIRWVGDSWWGVTPLLFAPRWVFLVPVAVLAAVSGVRRCFGHWALQGATALVAAGPLMGLSLPVGTLFADAPAGQRVRVATFNMSMDPIDVAGLIRWIEREKIDLLCFQEGRRDDPSLRAFLDGGGWHVSRKRGIASRFPIVEELPEYSAPSDTDKRYAAKLERVRLRTPSGAEFVAATVHLPTIRWGLIRLLSDADTAAIPRHNAWWGREVSRVLTELARTGGLPLLAGGDFNMPPDDSTMAALRRSHLFAFDEAGWGYGYTRPARPPWVRIDHVLASPEWQVTACRVGPDLGSDHLPVLAEAVLPPAPAKAAPPSP
jgi:endonuclease/exonuclease/phosphatase (EEP) superfamily protein YafD